MKRLAMLLPCLLLAACGGDGGDTKTVTVKSDATPTATASAEATATAAASASPTADAEGIATAGSAVDGVPVRLDVVGLKRSGETLVLNLRLTAPEAEEDDSAQVAGTFDDGQFQEVEGGESTIGGSTLDGISLVDTKNQKRYLVGRDETGQCVCDTDLGDTFVEREAPALLSATFAAPPPDVTSVNVVIPDFGTLADVPVS